MLLAATTLLGALFVAVMPPGLPYDEPSHWSTVLFYVQNASMPVLGDPGVTYEAQQAPLSYGLNALVAGPLRMFSDSVAFYGVRILGLLEHLALTALVWRLARQVAPALPRVATMAAVSIGLNPMLLAMSTSVQNDTLAILLATAAVSALAQSALSLPRAALAGALVGLAMLTKIVIWPLALAAGCWLLARRLLKPAAVYAIVATALFAWWPVRNYVLYGDLTGRAGVREAGYEFPPLDDSSVVALGRSAVTYLWLPTEYVRNTVSAPAAIELVAIGLTALGVVGAVVAVARRQLLRVDLAVVLAAAAVLAVGAWLITGATSQAVAFRVAYAALPFWLVLAVGGSALAVRSKWLPVALGGLLLAVSAWFLVSVAGLPNYPFDIVLAHR